MYFLEAANFDSIISLLDFVFTTLVNPQYPIVSFSSPLDKLRRLSRRYPLLVGFEELFFEDL